MGYLRIWQLMTGKEPDVSKGFIEINETDLEYFAEAYFTYLLMRIAESRLFQLPIYRIFKNIRKKLDNKEFENIRDKLDKTQLSCLNRVRSSVKYNNYCNAALLVSEEGEIFQQLIISQCNTELSTHLDKINSKEIENCIEKLKNHITSEFSGIQGSDLRFAVKYLAPFYRNKAVVGNYSLKAIMGVKNRKDAFRKKYIDPVLNQSETPSPEENSFLCRQCKRNYVHPETFSDDDSFFTEGMFSTIALTKGFTNFYYNSQPDLFICDVCELIILCAWAGFTRIPWQFRDDITNTDYIFVNVYSLELLWEENKRVYNQYQAAIENIQGTIYPEIIQDLFQRPFKTKGHWVIQNILFIEIKSSYKKNDRPNLRYYHIGHDIADLFLDPYAMDAVSKLIGKVETHNNIRIPLRRGVVDRILNHETLFPLCYALIKSHLDYTSSGNNLKNLFNILIISTIRNYIEFSMVEGKHLLSSAQIYGILSGTRKYGNEFAEDIDFDTRKRKSYVLLSMIRNDKIENFYDILLKMYMSVNKPVPTELIAMLNEKDEIGFSTRAYAFMSGFLGTK